MAKVTTTFVSDEKDVIDAIAKMNADMAKLRDQNKKLAEESKKAKEEAKSGFQQGINSLAKMAASYMTASAAAGVLTKELQSQWELQKKIADTQVRAAGSEREFLMNLGIVSPTQRQDALKQLSGISQKTGVAMTSLYGAGGAALSASGGDVGVAMSALEKAAEIAPHSAQAIAEMAGAIIDLNKATGSLQGDKGLDLLVQLQAGSRIKEMDKLASNAPQGIVGATIAGFTPEGAAALYEALSNAMVDKMGARTSTAESALAARLREFMPEEDTYTGKGRNRKIARKGVGKMTGEERFLAIANDPKMRQTFLDTLEQSESKPFVEAMLTPGSREFTMFQDSLSRYKSQKPGESQKFIAGIGDTNLQRSADFSRRTEQKFEQDMLAADEAGRYELVRDRLEKTLTGAGYGWSDRTSAWLNYQARSFAQGPEAAGIGVMENAIAATQGRQQRFGGDAAATQAIVSKLQEQIDVLKEFKLQRAANPNVNVEGQ